MGALIMRALLFWCLYEGPQFFGNSMKLPYEPWSKALRYGLVSPLERILCNDYTILLKEFWL